MYLIWYKYCSKRFKSSGSILMCLNLYHMIILDFIVHESNNSKKQRLTYIKFVFKCFNSFPENCKK